MDTQEFVSHTAAQVRDLIEDAWQEEYAEHVHWSEMTDATYYPGLAEFQAKVLQAVTA